MSIQRGREYLAKFGRDGDVIEFTVSSATVELAAKALGCEGALIAKTLSFYDGDSAMLVIAAGDARVDNKKFKAYFGFKARMLSPEDVERFTGHAIGGVCPFGLAQPIPVYLDESLRRFEFVYPAVGSSNSAIKLTPDELFTISAAKDWVDVCKTPESDA